MADGFGRVPVEAKVAARDREVGGDGQLFAGSETKEGAIVADAELQFRSWRMGGAEANSAEQSQLTEAAGTQAGGARTSGAGAAGNCAGGNRRLRLARHDLRIGYGAVGERCVGNRRGFVRTFKGADARVMSQKGAQRNGNRLRELHRNLWIFARGLGTELACKWLNIKGKAMAKASIRRSGEWWYSSNDGGRFSLTRF